MLTLQCLREERDRVLAALDQLDGAQLAVFGEALVPGYPIWLDRTGGARFNDPEQKRWHARYLEQAVVLERGDLARVQERVAALGIHAVLGIIERAPDRSGQTLAHGDGIAVTGICWPDACRHARRANASNHYHGAGGG